MSYDDWKTTEPDDPYPSKPVKYSCIDCAWRGLSADAFEHHQRAHHRLVMDNGVQAAFSCCPQGVPEMPVPDAMDQVLR